MIYLPEYLVRLFHHRTDDRFLTPYTRSHILELEPLSSLSLLVLPGQTSIWMYGSGPDPVFSVKDLKYIVTPSPRSQLLLPLIIDLSKRDLDLVGPLPSSQGYTYLVTIIDRFTRWPEAFPIPDGTAPTVARAIVSGWISCFGVPSTVTTDCGCQFESTSWKELMELLGTRRLRTTAYHPIANGIVEQFHHQLKAVLKAYPQPTHLVDLLHKVLLGIRTALKNDLVVQ